LQNIFHSSSLLGFPDDYVKKRLDDIIDFAEIGEFINQPVRTYSSGMYVRLAFSLFANLDPDIYIVDEALSVGDIFFQQKCFSRLREMIGNGTTIIFVSHDFEAIRSLCSKVIVLNAGEIQYV
jgi:ABC-type polysaccharide/polyol phosphate transport system ATPase subunit